MATILLVENDAMQASSRMSILERRFQAVERVADPVEALCLVEQPQFAGQLALVICGSTVPGIGGPAFVAELHERLPLVPVLVLGAKDDSAGDYAGSWVRFLARPVASDDLLTAADELLRQAALTGCGNHATVGN